MLSKECVGESVRACAEVVGYIDASLGSEVGGGNHHA